MPQDRLRAPRTSLAPRYAITLARAQHGTRSGYVAGCRCEDCTRADRIYQRTRDRSTQ